MRDDLDDYLISIGKVAIAAAFLEEVVIHWGAWLSDNPQGTLLKRLHRGLDKNLDFLVADSVLLTAALITSVAVGTFVSSHAPRIEPYVRLSRIRLPPWVYDGKDFPYAFQRLLQPELWA